MTDRHDPKRTPDNTTNLTATNSHIGTTAQVTGSPNAVVHQVNIASNDSPISSAIVAGAVKFTQLAEMMLGPATRELAEMWKDQVRAYRYERQLKCVVKAEKMAKIAGFTPQAVPIKLLFPLLEGASLEEDEDLHTMWAALLANAADPRRSRTNVRPGFSTVLRSMAWDEARLLEWMFDRTEWVGPLNGDMPQFVAVSVPMTELRKYFTELQSGSKGIDGPSNFGAVLNSLESQCLIKRRLTPDAKGQNVTDQIRIIPDPGFGFRLTARGFQFIAACRPPSLGA